MTRNDHFSQYLKIAAKWGVSLALIGLLVILVDLGEVHRVLKSADTLLFTIAVGVMLGDRLFMAGKWLPLLRVQFPEAGVGRAIKVYFASSFAALLLPASVGGDVLRSYGLGRGRNAVVEVGASIVIERVLGLVGSGIVALAALWVAISEGVQIGFLLPWAVGCAGAGLVAAIVPFSPTARHAVKRTLRRFGGSRWTGLVERFGTAYSIYRGHAQTLVVVGGLSVVEQLVPVFVYWTIARGLQLGISIEALVVAVPLSMFAARIPIGVAGIGILEGGLIYLLGLFGIPAAQAFSLAVAGRAVEFIAVLPGSLWWSKLMKRDGLQMQSDEDNTISDSPIAKPHETDSARC